MAKKTLFPMLARDATKVIHNPDGTITITSEKFGDEKYIGEIKYDGSRYIIQWDEDGKVFCTSRNASVKDGLPVDKTENLRGYLFDDCKALAGITIDGEVLVKINGEFVKENGSSEVNKIMLSAPDKAKLRLLNPDIELVYVAYDCLSFSDGVNIIDLVEGGHILHTRKEVLREVIKEIILHLNAKYVCKYILSETFVPSDEKLQEIFDAGHEGMMLKDIGSSYEQNEHSKHWLKVKKMLTEDGIIMGGQIGGGKYKDTLGALIIGQFFKSPDDEAMAIYTSRCNGVKDKEIFLYGEIPHFIDGDDLYQLKEVCTISGMDDEMRHNFWSSLKGFVLDKDAIFNAKGHILINPEAIRTSQIVEFMAQEKTQARYRHPRFLQIREDKPMVDCIFNN